MALDRDEIVRKYLGKRCGDGASGCFLFVKAFYREQFGVELESDYLEMLGKFQETKDPEIGDIVVIANHPVVTNHCGIYLGDNYFMHGGHSKDRNEVMIHRTNLFPYAKKVRGFLRYPKAHDKTQAAGSV
jgi:cell wall-associated NlpC family hydrolase